MQVTVIIPCHDVEQHLARTLDSVLAQEHTDLDVLCVDDGSTDGTAAVLEHYAREHPGRFRLHRQENRGASAARNEGLRLTRGEWVQFLDADDAIAPDKIGGQLALARATQADLIIGDYENVMPNGLLLPVQALHDRPWMGLIKTKLGTTSANLWRRGAVEKAGGWSEDLGSSQDYDLMFRMMRNGARVAFDPRIVASVLKRVKGSISLNEPKANWERYIDLRHRMRVHLAALDARAHAEEIATLDQYIFMALRVLAQYDLDGAIHAYRRTIPRGFVPDESRAITARYVRFHKLLGFAGAERLVHLFRKPTPA